MKRIVNPWHSEDWHPGNVGHKKQFVWFTCYGDVDMSFLKKPKPAAKPAELPKEEIDRWPALLEWLTADQGPDGRKRQTATLFVFFEAGLFKGALNDRDSQMTAWVADLSPLGLLDALDVGLQSDSLDWKPNKVKDWKGSGSKAPKKADE